MILRLLLAGIVLVATITTASAAKIYQVSNPDEANIRVAIVRDRGMADLLVYRVSSRALALGDAVWFVTRDSADATVRLSFVSVDASEVKVYFVDTFREAGWVRPHRLRGSF